MVLQLVWQRLPARDLLQKTQKVIVVDDFIEGGSEQVHQIENLTRLDAAPAHFNSLEDYINEI